MRIQVFVRNDDFYFLDINVSYLFYDKLARKYFMSAGGYDISGGKLPSPMSVEDDGRIQKITFTNFDEALQFLEWIKDAYARTRESFTTMMD